MRDGVRRAAPQEVPAQVEGDKVAVRGQDVAQLLRNFIRKAEKKVSASKLNKASFNPFQVIVFLSIRILFKEEDVTNIRMYIS